MVGGVGAAFGHADPAARRDDRRHLDSALPLRYTSSAISHLSLSCLSSKLGIDWKSPMVSRYPPSSRQYLEIDREVERGNTYVSVLCVRRWRVEAHTRAAGQLHSRLAAAGGGGAASVSASAFAREGAGAAAREKTAGASAPRPTFPAPLTFSAH